MLFMATLATQAQVSSDSLAAARAEIIPLLESMVAAANAHDAEKHVSFYAKDRPSSSLSTTEQLSVGMLC